MLPDYAAELEEIAEKLQEIGWAGARIILNEAAIYIRNLEEIAQRVEDIQVDEGDLF